jgi:glycyl-tRNA synthetase beta chain
MVDKALPLLAARLRESADKVRDSVLDFFQGRLQHLLVSQEGFGPDLVEASLSTGIDDIVEAVSRTKALAAFRSRPDFDELATTIKRVANIIKDPEISPVDDALLTTAAEQALYMALRDVEGIVKECLARSDYEAALESMAGLKGFVDSFFDSVLVMDKDENLRRNRLGLLTRIRDLFGQVADFRKIQTN